MKQVWKQFKSNQQPMVDALLAKLNASPRWIEYGHSDDGTHVRRTFQRLDDGKLVQYYQAETSSFTVLLPGE